MESNAVDQVPLCDDDNEESGEAAVKGYPPESVPQSDIISEDVFCHRADNNIKSIKFNIGNHTDHSLKPKSAYKVDSFVPIQNSLSALHTCPTNDLVNMNSTTPDINQDACSTTEVGNCLATSLDNNSCLVSNCVLPIQNSRTTCDNTRQYNCDSRSKVATYDKDTTSPTIELDDSIPSCNGENSKPNLHQENNLDKAFPISTNDTSPNDRETNCILPDNVISETCSVNNTEHKHNPIHILDIKSDMQNCLENNDLQFETNTDLKNEPFRNAANEESKELIETDCSKECTDAEDLQLKAGVIGNQMSLSSSLDVIIEEMEELQGLLEVDVHKEDTNSLKGIDEVLDEIDIDNMSESYGYISDECEHIETTVVINDTDISTDIEPTSSSELIDSEILPKDLTPNIKVNHIAYEEEDNTYQEDTASVKLLHQSECSNQIYCETSFGKSDIDCEISEWKSKHRLSRSSKARKVSLEQRLKRRFTINDEHKHEVAKRIIALVIKYSLFVFNFCSWVIASVIIGIGLWLLTDKGRIATEGTDFFLDPSIMICTVGGITFVVALLGCVGALRENLLLLKVFFLVLAIIVVVELIIAITIFVMYTVPSVKDKFLRSTPENILRTAIQKYMDDSKLKIWIDLIQQENETRESSDFDPTTVLSGELHVQALDQYSELLGLVSPSFLYGAALAQDYVEPLHADANSRIVQIHIIPGHYVVSCQDEGQITIYDSVPYVERSVQLLPQLKVRYSLLDDHPDPLSLVKYIIPQIQSGSSDCGLFAAANAYLLLSGTNPQNVILQQSELRSHLHRCLKLKSVTPFPTSATNITDSAINRYFSKSISLQQQKLTSSVNTDKSSNRSRSSYFREWRAKRDAKQVLKDKQIDLKRKSESRKTRTISNIVKDRQIDKKHRSEKRSNRTSDQIVKDRQSAQKRMSDSRASRTSDHIVKDRLSDQKRKSVKRSNRTSDQIVKDRQSAQKRMSESRASRTSDHIVKDRKSDQKRKSVKRSNRTSDQIVKDKQSDLNRKSDSRASRTNDHIFKDRQCDKKHRSVKRSNRTSDQIVKDRQSDQNRKSDSRSKRSTYQIVKDRQSDKQRRVQKRKIIASELVKIDRQKDCKRKTASRRNRTSDQIFKDKISDKKRKAHYRENRDEAQIRKEKDKEAQRWQIRQKYRFASVDEQKRYENFKREIQSGPIYPCNICHRTFTRNGVIELSEKYISKLNSKCSGLYQTVAEENVFMNDKQYICLTCNRWLMHKQKIPPLSVKNGLTIENIPCELDLSELSNVLVAKNIIFLKLFKLPKSRWSALKDKIINVPITDDDILRTLSELTSLPRLPDQAGLIPVQLKRKMSYKSAVQEAYIDPQKLIIAVAKLKELKHPGYTAVNLPNNYLENFNTFLIENNNYNPEESMENIEAGRKQKDKPQHEQYARTEENKDVDCGQDTLTDSKGSIDNQEEDEDDIQSDQDPIYQKQSNIQSATVMSNSFPEVSIIEPTNNQHDIDSTESHAIAPGEGKIPSNLMRDKLWDVNAFPSFHPTGKYGLHHQRDIKLQPQQYFVQRLQNVNKRFSSCPPYVFAAQYYIERQQLEQNINISYLKGRVSGGNLLELHDSFAVFEKIPGTPKYWLNKRYELLAKLENLGAFQFFFTLSMADMRWPEIVTSVLAQEGKHIEYNSSQFDDPSIITINGEPFEDYVKRESVHELVKNNVLTATRCFDQRVKAFIKHIIQGKNSPMCVKYFNYRVEFQLRGAGHIHGVLWINVDQMEKMIPGITLALTSLRLHEQLSEKQCDILADFVDRFTCCSLQNDVSEIVRQVQIHKHSRTCSKYGMTCRFSYPKFPSKKTIIAQPLSKTDFESDAKYKSTVSKYTATLDSVRKVLGNLEEDKLASYSVNDVLNLAKVNEKDYEKALSVSSVGTTIVMKRAVDEIYVNNYNPEWIRAWNGNMDLQVCLDYHAVITYITDYYSKDESGTMDFLKQAARENSHKDRTELMRLLSQVFLPHRQNGECEAYYKIFPNLHLTDSNVKIVFVATNFPDQRYKFLVKVSDNQNAPATGIENEPENEGQEIDVEPEPLEPGSLISVAGKEGKFSAKTSVHERYALRPIAIENICLAQFATLYETCSKISAKAVLFVNNIRGESTHKLICSDIRDVFLPNYIKLSDETYMKIRSYPAVLRKHKFRMDTQYHEFLFSDLLLYTPWRKESSLYYHNFDKCIKLYESKREHITFVQETLFPHMNTVQESQLLLETASDHRSTHIGDVINPQHEQDQEDQALLGVEEDENYASRHPGELLDREEIMQLSANRNMYRRIDISDKDSMAGMVQELDCHQRRVFDTVIKYCKDLRKSVQSRANVPEPPLLLVHGGAGSGKSTLIHAISVWAESILRTSDNRHPDYPLIIRNAPTGTAASNISGLTIHSSFNLRFGNSFNSLPDKQRDTQRNILSYLQILIIDEISMMKADMLYQLNLRLQEIKQNKNDFGGISVLLFGDIMQLRPVKARWIFDEPSNPVFALSYSVRSLWELFQVVELKINHRQGDDHDYADLLNRVRLGKHTENDIQILQSRVRNEFPTDAIHLYGKIRNVYEYNEDKLTEFQGVEYTIMAQNIHPARTNYEPKISKEGLVNDSPFLNKLKIKETARIMLIYNIDTGDGLTNGALGEIVQINTKERNEVKDLLIRFDNPDIGKQLRKSHHIQNDLTPIGKISFSYSLGSIKKGHAATAKVVQFPLRLAWAVTVHKFQGQTVKPPASLVGHMESIFDKGQAYVLLGRVQSLSQLYLSSCSAEMIKVWPEALEQVTKLADRAVNNTETLWQSNKTNCFRMAALNTRSLNRHFHDITCDSTLMLCDFICLSETWAVTDEDAFNIEDFSLYTCGSGRGKGVAVYSRKEHTLLHSAAFESSDYQILHLQYPHIELTIVYISPSSRSHADIAEKLKSVITHDKTSVVCGDFNTDFNKLPDSIVSKTLRDIGFQQVITDSTYIEGSLLDHMYTNAEPELQFVHPAYFSDHDATCLLIPKF